MEALETERKLRENILKTFMQIKKEADENQICKRKGVGAAILELDLETRKGRIITAINGPSGPNNECSNVVGACGCSHAEPRVIIKYLKVLADDPTYIPLRKLKRILLSTYSPCVPCANLAIDSDIIDAFAYEIWAPHWNKHPYYADEVINNSNMEYWTYDMIADTHSKILSNWLDS